MKGNSQLQIILALSFVMVSGCAGTQRLAQPDDHIQMDFTCYLQDNSLVDTTLAQTAGDEALGKSPLFTLRDEYRPVRLKVTGKPETITTKPFDPLEQKISIALAKEATRLSLTQPTRLELPSREIADFPERDRYLKMAMKFTMSRDKAAPKQEFVSHFGESALVVGKTIASDTPYPAVVRKITDDAVDLHYSVREGTIMQQPWGPAVIREKSEDEFEGQMDVQVGKLLPRVGGLPGIVTEVGEKTFTIDYGQSFAGETLYCDVSAHTYDPALQPVLPVQNWTSDFEKGLALAKQQGKPVLLFLYADWCEYCHRMQDKVFPDPALDEFRDAFIWLKINSDTQKEHAERFGQKAFPLILALNPDGSVAAKLEGFQHITTVAHTLDTVLSTKPTAN